MEVIVFAIAAFVGVLTFGTVAQHPPRTDSTVQTTQQVCEGKAINECRVSQ